MNDKKPKVVKEEFELNGWRFEFSKSGIMPSQQLDNLKDELKLNNIPDVVFGENCGRFIYNDADFCLEFSPKDSLCLTNFQSRKNAYLDLSQNQNIKHYKQLNNCTVIPSEVKVKYSQQWKNKKPQDPTTEVRVIEQISDVFFSTPYKGTIKKVSTLIDPQQNENYFINAFENQLHLEELQQLTLPYVEKTNDELPLHNLTEQNPIKWSTMIHLWEDELGIQKKIFYLIFYILKR
ncbi:tip41-like family protein, putative [Ichthyophthirius multifiliis]|uniref:Tip41-like family protein, putative n=1 Tax=Ichthyophthirius multifiliis TaxID=5932 RepID=G0QUJ2_ICHMU|nr:tip41-like family protein, putative [Ichthyophthirius multifiliis]EGR31112.1 tip41-like family protein, putative [Ichthyophthirius multifiliis]|eukprot:XP_004034598.1 tip41-like family protein, putative [Ichthyophthirius multifiliis]